MCREYHNVLQTSEEADLILWRFAYCEDTLHCMPMRLALIEENNNDGRTITRVDDRASGNDT